MWRILFLIFVLFSSIAFAHIPDTPLATKFDEAEITDSGKLKSKTNRYFSKLSEGTTALGLILFYGKSREIKIGQNEIIKMIRSKHFDRSRIKFVNGGYSKKSFSEFWIVPPGATQPEPEQETVKMDVFEKGSNQKIKLKLDDFLIEVLFNPRQQGFVLSRGNSKEVAEREHYIRKYLLKRKIDLSKIKFLKDVNDKQLITEFWLKFAKPNRTHQSNLKL